MDFNDYLKNFFETIVSDLLINNSNLEERLYDYESNFHILMTENNLTQNEKLYLRDISKKLNSNFLEIYYQPKVNLQTGEVIGAEALTRFKDNSEKILQPERIINVLEKADMMLSLDKLIFKTTLEKIKEWDSKSILNFPIAINCSSKIFQSEDLVSYISKLLKDYNLNSNLIQIELTEKGKITNCEVVKSNFEELSKLGVYTLIDDFGTGYASMERFEYIKADAIKIDKKFLLDFENKPFRNIIETIKFFAELSGVETVIEGIEEFKHLEFSRELGFKEGQGYHFSRPLCSREFEKIFLNKGRRHYDLDFGILKPLEDKYRLSSFESNFLLNDYSF